MNIIKKLFGSSENSSVTFDDLPLSDPIHEALRKVGYTSPTPIQAQAIPAILEGKDLQGIAQTGTGKTAAFSLPILDLLSRKHVKVNAKHTRVLILTPTRELAAQIQDSLIKYGSEFHFKTAVIFGGVNERPQIRAMDRGVDLLVATPGRLLDLMGQGHLKLNTLEIFVLDEADRMLDMGFIHDVRKIVATLPQDRQTLFFSATMPPDIEKLADQLLNDPHKIAITPPATTVERIDQKLMFVEKDKKKDLLLHLLNTQAGGKTLIFSRTKHGCDRIVKDLEKAGIKCSAIHGNKSQNARVRALRSFKTDALTILIATDIAARGIDVDGIQTVFNYDLPNEPESYVHRIGRTARAGKDGHAIAFCDSSEQFFLKNIERTIGQSIPLDKDHEWHVTHDPRAPQFKQNQNGRGGRRGGSGHNNGQRQGGSRSGGRSSSSGPRSGGERSSSGGQRSSSGRFGGGRDSGSNSGGQRRGQGGRPDSDGNRIGNGNSTAGSHSSSRPSGGNGNGSSQRRSSNNQGQKKRSEFRSPMSDSTRGQRPGQSSGGGRSGGRGGSSGGRGRSGGRGGSSGGGGRSGGGRGPSSGNR